VPGKARGFVCWPARIFGSSVPIVSGGSQGYLGTPRNCPAELVMPSQRGDAVSSATILIFLTLVRPVLKFIGWFATIHVLTLGYGAAMEFHIEFNPEEKIGVIVGEGAIIAGDATRLEAMLGKAGRDEYGNIVLYLDSPGGSVAAAFEMVKIMDREEFSALVASGSICASACASIVYISARFHQILGSGKLGIHTCYYTKNGPPEPAPFCNEQIAKNAYEHGTSYGAVNMWQKSYGAESMAWIGRDVACKFGLCGPPGFDATRAVPSFDCKLAKRPSELAICSNKGWRGTRHRWSKRTYD
jgi:hypothetical protein